MTGKYECSACDSTLDADGSHIEPSMHPDYCCPECQRTERRSHDVDTPMATEDYCWSCDDAHVGPLTGGAK